MIREVTPQRSYRQVVPVIASAATIAASISSGSLAGLVSLHADAYVVHEGGQFFSVIDLYADLPSLEWQVASVAGDVSLLGGPTWFHDDASGACPSGGTWLPATSAAHPLADSFVTIGSPLAGLPNFTLLAPTFIDDPACSSFLGAGAGWFNSVPPSGQGFARNVVLHDGSELLSATMLGRFSILGPPTDGAGLKLESFWVAYNIASAPPQVVVFDQATFSYVPTPTTLCAIVGCMFLGGRRRRSGSRLRQRRPGSALVGRASAGSASLASCGPP